MAISYRPLILLALLLGLSPAAQALRWRMCLHDVPPSPEFSKDPARPGRLERLLMDAGREAGLELEFRYVPAARCMAEAARGEVEATLVADNPPNRANFQLPLLGQAADSPADERRRLMRVRFLLLTRAGSPLHWDGQAFSGTDARQLTFGLRRSFQAAIGPLRARGLTVDDSVSSLRQVLEMLQRQRFDVAVAMDVELHAELGGHWPAWLAVLGPPLATVNVYPAPGKQVWQQHAPKVQAWWSAIARLRDLPAYASD